MELTNFKQVMKFALEKEQEAVNFYQECSKLTARPAMKEAFLEMAEEEKKHVRMIQNFKPEHVDKLRIKEIPNLKISDFLVDMEFKSGMTYQDLLILAMKREEKSYELYTSLAQRGGDPSIVKLFELLAQEELKHKNRLEKEYDEVILKEN